MSADESDRRESDACFSWGELDRFRRECFERFGGLFDLPIGADGNTEAARLLTPTSHVLDVGCGYRKVFGTRVSQPQQEYFTLDVDEGDFDFRRPQDIPADQRFDLINSQQMLEHVAFIIAHQLLVDLRPHLCARGRFVASVPNAAHPVRHRDPSHVTPYSANDFYALFRMAGYEVEALKRYGKRGLPWNPLARWVALVVARTYRIDWMDSLIIIARNPGAA